MAVSPFAQPAFQLVGEKNITQLGASVGPVAKVALWVGQVVHIHCSCLPVRVGRNIYHTCRRRSGEQVLKQVGQHEVGEVVHRKGRLDPVDGPAPQEIYRSSIVDQDV